jgi:hypothetical protein
MPRGGRIPNQGNQPQAPGIGRDAKRHDLEAGATPGLGGPDKGPTDLQSGDVQELEQGQRISNKATQAPATAQRAKSGKRPKPARGDTPPDAIDFFSRRSKQGTLPPRGQTPEFDLGAWMPFLKELARNPNRSGPLATAIIQQLSNHGAQAAAGNVRVVDENALQKAIEAGLQ